jgi:hypothetical protein
MRRFATIALLSLAACGPTKQLITSRCELDALNHYPEQTNASLQLIADYAETCMRAHGYKIDRSLAGCTYPGVSEMDIVGEAMCYRADSGRPVDAGR